MRTDEIDYFDSKEKAIDHAIWLNFKYRIAGIVFGVIHDPEDNFAVCEEATVEEMGMKFLNILPEGYGDISYRHIGMDGNPLPQWEQIRGMVSVMDGEVLRFILHTRLSVDRLIRHELALRGHDKNHRWCGFNRAREIWLEDN